MDNESPNWLSSFDKHFVASLQDFLEDYIKEGGWVNFRKIFFIGVKKVSSTTKEHK